MSHNNAQNTDWDVIKTADVEIDGGEITDATLYGKEGIYMMVVRGESNYGPDENYAEWDTDNYKEAVAKFKDFVAEHSKSNKKLNSSEQSVLTTQDIYDEVEEYVRDKVFAAVLDVQDTCQRNVIMNVVPEYDPEWCAEEWTDEDDDKQLEACTALLDLIMSGLFRHANLRD